MRPSITVLKLCFRKTMGILILLIFALAAADIGLYFVLGSREGADKGGGVLSRILTPSTLSLLLFGAAVIVLIYYCSWLDEKGSVYRYTLRRLPISERRVVFLHGVANFVCFVVLLGMQLIILIALAKYHVTKDVYSQVLKNWITDTGLNNTNYNSMLNYMDHLPDNESMSNSLAQNYFYFCVWALFFCVCMSFYCVVGSVSHRSGEPFYYIWALYFVILPKNLGILGVVVISFTMLMWVGIIIDKTHSGREMIFDS